MEGVNLAAMFGFILRASQWLLAGEAVMNYGAAFWYALRWLRLDLQLIRLGWNMAARATRFILKLSKKGLAIIGFLLLLLLLYSLRDSEKGHCCKVETCARLDVAATCPVLPLPHSLVNVIEDIERDVQVRDPELASSAQAYVTTAVRLAKLQRDMSARSSGLQGKTLAWIDRRIQKQSAFQEEVAVNTTLQELERQRDDCTWLSGKLSGKDALEAQLRAKLVEAESSLVEEAAARTRWLPVRSRDMTKFPGLLSSLEIGHALARIQGSRSALVQVSKAFDRTRGCFPSLQDIRADWEALVGTDVGYLKAAGIDDVRERIRSGWRLSWHTGSSLAYQQGGPQHYKESARGPAPSLPPAPDKMSEHHDDAVASPQCRRELSPSEKRIVWLEERIKRQSHELAGLSSATEQLRNSNSELQVQDRKYREHLEWLEAQHYDLQKTSERLESDNTDLRAHLSRAYLRSRERRETASSRSTVQPDIPQSCSSQQNESHGSRGLDELLSDMRAEVLEALSKCQTSVETESRAQSMLAAKFSEELKEHITESGSLLSAELYKAVARLQSRDVDGSRTAHILGDHSVEETIAGMAQEIRGESGVDAEQRHRGLPVLHNSGALDDIPHAGKIEGDTAEEELIKAMFSGLGTLLL